MFVYNLRFDNLHSNFTESTIQKMRIRQTLPRLLFAVILMYLMTGNKARASHIIGGDIYWECISSGPDAGKFIFYLSLYRDCSVTGVVVSAPELYVANCPVFQSFPLNLLSVIDVSPASCGISCPDGIQSLSIAKHTFASDPITIPGPPPPQGYTFSYNACCRIACDNLVNAYNELIYYSATMYPFNGLDMFPCYDSSPQFAEAPTPAFCTGSNLRYSHSAVDENLDSLSYSFVAAMGEGGYPIEYIEGYTANQPLPGPAINSTYDEVTLNSFNGQIEYNGPEGIQGRWVTVVAVDAWRCGQRISRSIRDMSVAIIPCSDSNSFPVVDEPVWSVPASASGYEVTVMAGDMVSFELTGYDSDFSGINPQVLSFEASGAQFGTNFSDPNSGCANAPCATLTNVTPPVALTDTISTVFNWQTTCDHIAFDDQCPSYSNTYNFLFTFQDDHCPVNASNTVNVSVTVLAEEVVQSPKVRCVSTDTTGAVTIEWLSSTDNAVPPSFVEYAIFHRTSSSDPYQQIATDSDIGSQSFVHDSSNPIVVPSTSGANYYLVRTRSACNDAVLSTPSDTISSIHLSLMNSDSTADLSWTPLTFPPLSSSSGNGLYEVYREYPLGTWELIASTHDLLYSDSVHWSYEQINYRVELADDLPCISVSNVVGDVFNYMASINQYELEQIVIQPNPNNGTFRMDVSSEIKWLNIEVMDLAGKILVRDYRRGINGSVEMDTDLPAGAYLLRIGTNKSWRTQRLVIQ